MTTRADLFNAAHDDYVPTSDDSPDCIPFYRAWAGLQAAWGKEFCDQNNGAVHRCACECSHSHPTMSRYELAVYMLRYLADGAKTPDEPRYSYSYRCEPSEPSEPSEKDARDVFAAQFKRKWPNERLNGKLAREKWAQVSEKAWAIARENYQTALAAYRAHEESIDRENAKRRAEWQARVDSIAAFKTVVASVTA